MCSFDLFREILKAVAGLTHLTSKGAISKYAS